MLAVYARDSPSEQRGQPTEAARPGDSPPLPIHRRWQFGVRFVVHLRFLIPLFATVGICGARAHAADPSSPTTGRAPESHVSVLTGEQVIQILDETVDWYRTLGTQQQNATQPSDLLIVFANRQTADKVVGLAFEIARANAELLSSEASSGQSAANASAPPSLVNSKPNWRRNSSPFNRR